MSTSVFTVHETTVNLRRLIEETADGIDFDLEALRDTLPRSGPFARISAESRRALSDQLSGALESFLDVDLGEAAVAGWKKHEELRASARATLDDPMSTEVVDLTDWEVRCLWQPTIEILLGQARVASLQPDLAVGLKFVGVYAVVANGCLTRLGGGRCSVTARMGLAGETIMERDLPVVPAVLAIPVGGGIPLLEA
jgi:hypothetical protein